MSIDSRFPCKQCILGMGFTCSLGLTGWYKCLCNSPSPHGPDSGGGGRPDCTCNLTTGGGGEECGGGGRCHRSGCMSVRTTGSSPGQEVRYQFESCSLLSSSLPPFLPSFHIETLTDSNVPPLFLPLFLLPNPRPFTCSHSLPPSFFLPPVLL